MKAHRTVRRAIQRPILGTPDRGPRTHHPQLGTSHPQRSQRDVSLHHRPDPLRWQRRPAVEHRRRRPGHNVRPRDPSLGDNRGRPGRTVSKVVTGWDLRDFKRTDGDPGGQEERMKSRAEAKKRCRPAGASSSDGGRVNEGSRVDQGHGDQHPGRIRQAA